MMNFLKVILCLILISISLNGFTEPRLIIHLSDYLANDYAGAVSEDKKVISDSEYAEQIEFAKAISKEALSDSKLKASSELQKEISSLEKGIKSKMPPSFVVPLARKIQKLVIKLSGITLSPSTWPTYNRGKELFIQNCTSCHGVEGRGDGTSGEGLDPKPANFHDLERAPTISPFAAFNTIRLGVPGTGMPAFDFSDDDVWSLAFYVSTFRFGQNVQKKNPIAGIDEKELLQKTASLNDQQLQDYLRSNGKDSSLVDELRLFSPSKNNLSSLSRTRELLKAAMENFYAKDFKSSHEHALNAYFEGFEPIENKISADDPKLVSLIEEKMAEFRKAIDDKDEAKLVSSNSQLQELLNQAGNFLTGNDITAEVAFSSGFAIILREGFEALLVIVAILGVAKTSGAAIVSLSVHAGWIVSLLLGVVGWFLSGLLLSVGGYQRELIEAITSSFAVFMLVYVGFWMHRQTEINRWKEFIGVKVKNLVQSKSLYGLFILAFIVSFREVLETVLFLRSIYSQDNSSINLALLAGVVVGLSAVFISAYLMLKLKTKIPLQKFFNLSSILMMALAVILAGKSIHAFQEAGLIGVNLVNFSPRIELLGIYPSLQVISAQIIIGVLCFIIWAKGRK